MNRGSRAFWIIVMVQAAWARCCLADLYTVKVLGGSSYQVLANAFDHTNTLGTLLPANALNVQVFRWDCAQRRFNLGAPIAADPVRGWPADVFLAPGEGVLVVGFGGSITYTFQGPHSVPALPLSQPCGCGQTNLIGGQTADAQTYESVTGWAPQEGAVVRRWSVAAQDWAATYVFSQGAWVPSVPALAPWEAALFYVPCQASQPLLLSGAANKSVAAGTSWHFDPPTVSSPKCGTNYTLAVVYNETNVAAAVSSFTRYWQVPDCLGDIATCNQTVTVQDQPPTIGAGLQAGKLRLSWPAAFKGWQLQSQTVSAIARLGTNWSTVAGATATNTMYLSIAKTNGLVCYRLAPPP
jgi:hypothetical protein